MKDYGQGWLENAIGGQIREICEIRVAITGDLRHSNKTMKAQEQEHELLKLWCDRIWDSIWETREDFPR
jgi:hypothetical protein